MGGGFVGAALLAWMALLALQDTPVPALAWIAIIGITIVTAGLAAIATLTNDSGHSKRHSSGELVLIRGYRERRQRGTRTALDWKHSFREYLAVPFVLFLGVQSGLDLLKSEDGLRQIAGALVVVGALVAAGALIRWLTLPVDSESKADLAAAREETRLDGRNIGRRVRSSRRS